jgi:hypothetical protein
MNAYIKVSGVPKVVNPLANLPASNSAPWTLNGLDLMKLLRMGIIMGVSIGIEYGVPALTGFKWEFGGRDYSGVMLVLMPVIIDAARRFIANSGVQVTHTGSLQGDSQAMLKALAKEAMQEYMREAAPPTLTPEQIAKAQRIAELEAQLEAEKSKP